MLDTIAARNGGKFVIIDTAKFVNGVKIGNGVNSAYVFFKSGDATYSVFFPSVTPNDSSVLLYFNADKSFHWIHLKKAAIDITY
jgi:hypothetical protein